MSKTRPWTLAEARAYLDDNLDEPWVILESLGKHYEIRAINAEGVYLFNPYDETEPEFFVEYWVLEFDYRPMRGEWPKEGEQ